MNLPLKQSVAGLLALGASSLAQTTLTWTPLLEPGVGGRVTSVSVSPHNGSLVLAGGDMLGIARSADGGSNWTPKGINLDGYEIADFTWHHAWSNDVWVGTMSGPYKSVDGGQTWAKKRNGMPTQEWGKYTQPIQKVLVDPNDNYRLLAFGGNWRRMNNFGNEALPDRSSNNGKVWESTNYGDTWTEKSRLIANTETNIVDAVFAAGSGSTTLFAAAYRHGVFKSTNDGGTWNAVNNGLPANAAVNALAAHPTDPNTLWVIVGDTGVYKTTNGGANWVLSNGTNGTAITVEGWFTNIRVAKNDGNRLYATNGPSQKLYRSSDGGASWSLVKSGPVDEPYGVAFQPEWLHVDPANKDRVFIGTPASIYRSTNGGPTMEDVTAFQPSGSTLWKGKGYSGLVSMAFKFNPWNGNIGIANALDDGKLLVSTDGLNTWKVHHANINHYEGGTEVSYTGSNGSTVYAALGEQDQWFATGGIFKSTDQGNTWSRCNQPSGTRDVATSVYANPTNANAVIAVWKMSDGSQRVFHSTDGGASWNQRTLPYSGGGETKIFQVSGNTTKTNATTFYASAYHGLYRSTDGITWTHVGGHWSGDWGALHIFPAANDANTLFYTVWNSGNMSADGLWRYNLSANSWTKLAGQDQGGSRLIYNIANGAVDPTNSNRIAVVTNENPFDDYSDSSGVWLTEDGGANWTQQNNGLGMRRVNCIAFSPDGNTLVCGTNGQGYYRATRGGLENGAVYELEPVCAPGKRLDVSGAGGSGSNVLIWTAHSGNNQRWRLELQSDGRYELIPQHSTGARLDVVGGGNADGVNVQIWNDLSSQAQRWKVLDQGNGTYELEPECAPGRRLDVNGSGSSNGTNVHVWMDNDTNAQRWRLHKQ